MDRGDSPLISVIIPVYNVEEYVSKCLDSVLGQSYENIEVLVIDDASTDSGGAVCDSYALRDSRLRVIHFDENKGVSNARNEGIRRASGSLITFIDADDYVESTMLESLYESMVQTGADVSICGFDRIGANKYAQLPEGSSACVLTGRQAITCMFSGVPFNWTTGSKLYQKELTEKTLFDETIHCGEDVFFSYQLLQLANKVSYIPDKLYHYVFRKNSATQGCFSEKQYTEFFVFERLIKDAYVYFPEFITYFQYKILDINTRLAVRVVEGRTVKGMELYRWLKRFQSNSRRYFSWKALSFFKFKKIAAEVLLLYCSTFAFWILTSLYKSLKRLFKN